MKRMKALVASRPALAALLVTILMGLGFGRVAAESKPVKPGWLGVSVVRVGGQQRAELGVDFGVRIDDVAEGSPAAKAGMREDDVIRLFAGRQIHDAQDLVEAVRGTEPGAVVTIGLRRAAKNVDVKVTLGEVPAHRKDLWHRFFLPPSGRELPRPGPEIRRLFAPRRHLGVTLLAIDEELGAYFGVKAEGGALVVRVEKDSPAASAGMKGGDVIVAVAGKKVTGPEDVREAVSAAKDGEEIAVTVRRMKEDRELRVKPDSRRSRSLRLLFSGERPLADGDAWIWAGAPDLALELPDEIEIADLNGATGGFPGGEEPGWPGNRERGKGLVPHPQEVGEGDPSI